MAERKLTKKEKAAIEARIDRAYVRACTGLLVSILDLGKIHAEGARAVFEGVTDEELERRIRAEAEKYRVHEKRA